MTTQTTLTPAEAVEAVKAGKTIKMTVGTAFDDPVLLVWQQDGGVESYAIKGWSEGVQEMVCDAGSAFLLTYFEGKHSLAVTTQKPPVL